MLLTRSLTLLCLAAMGSVIGDESPPFHGTIFVAPNVIQATDPTTYQSTAGEGQGLRTVFDRRTNSWNEENVFLFNCSFSEGLSVEARVNPEFETVEAAKAQAVKYAAVLGRLPLAVRTRVKSLTIHKGKELYGGGNDSILIHTGQTPEYERDGILEETLVHEGSHASLDGDHKAAPGWLAAQTADANFISDYARDHPTREDIAESFLLYVALRYRRDRISDELATKIEEAIPNRIRYFDEQLLSVTPLEPGLEIANESDQDIAVSVGYTDASGELSKPIERVLEKGKTTWYGMPADYQKIWIYCINPPDRGALGYSLLTPASTERSFRFRAASSGLEPTEN